MDDREFMRSERKARGPLETSTPKARRSSSRKIHRIKEELTNVSLESAHTDPPSSLSPVGPFSSSPEIDNGAKRRMIQSPAKNSDVAQPQPIPSPRKKNLAQRSWRSRSRSYGRNSRRLTSTKNHAPTPETTKTNLESLGRAKRIPTTTTTTTTSTATDKRMPRKHSSPNFSNINTYPYILLFLRLLMLILYVFIAYKAITYFGADRFFVNLWND